jgi:3-methyladenine DNA glycosylase/8-oxoguanine DNA glycosylase
VLDDAALRGVGLSRQKVSYLRDLCAHIGEGRLQLAELEMLPDEEVIERLTRVKGFGRWTAEMFLMFRLHRPDVLPLGDLGIVNAVQRLYRFAQAAELQAACQDRRSLAAVPIGRVLVSLADTATHLKVSKAQAQGSIRRKPEI